LVGRIKPWHDGGSRITLSKEHRDAARWSGIDEATYARGLKKLNDLKRQGFYNES
jgi:hypothetical protein